MCTPPCRGAGGCPARVWPRESQKPPPSTLYHALEMREMLLLSLPTDQVTFTYTAGWLGSTFPLPAQHDGAPALPVTKAHKQHAGGCGEPPHHIGGIKTLRYGVACHASALLATANIDYTRHFMGRELYAEATEELSLASRARRRGLTQ